MANTNVKRVCAGVFYFSLGNLHPKYRSQYSSIHLVALCKRKFISLYSITDVLRPLIKDIKRLVSLMLLINVNIVATLLNNFYRKVVTSSRSAMLKKQFMGPSVSSLLKIQQTIFWGGLRKQVQHIACVVSAWPPP